MCPATILQHWLREFHHWYPSVRVCILHGVSSTGSQLNSLGDKGVEFAIRRLQRSKDTQGLVIVTTYEGLRRHHKSLSLVEWTAVCLDEGQKIRNPDAQLTTICKGLPAFHRVILSGTPIQNNLSELWSLVDFCYPGRLGTLPAFQVEFATPIRLGGYSGVSRLQAETAVRIATALQRIVHPLLLRRRKDDVAIATRLPNKTEQVLFCSLSSRQRHIYREILNSSEVQAVLSKNAASFRAITTLRKLCNHPALVYQQGRVVWHVEPGAGKDKDKGKGSEKDKGKGKGQGKGKGKGQKRSRGEEDEDEDGEEDDDEHEDEDDIELIDGLDWSDSGKLLVLSKVLPLWHREGHKVLIFSQTQSMLNLVETMLRQFKFRFMRLDGSTPVGRREGIVQTFNSDESIFAMVLTTRTGGVGISLTAANRVVLIDPDWNPQTDVQARERAWRLGQKRDVTIFRLITRGTIEEKIYQRQIFKLLLSNRILDNPQQKALFSKADISELFELTDDFDELPAAGHVDLSSSSSSSSYSATLGAGAGAGAGALQLSSASAAAAAASASASASASSARAGEEGEEGEEDEGECASEPLDIEEFREQILPAGALDPPPPLPSNGAGSTAAANSSNNNGSDSRDRRLLQALFAGEALACVYDHAYLEPGGFRARPSGRDEQRAAQSALNAERNLRASVAPQYQGQGQGQGQGQTSGARAGGRPGVGLGGRGRGEGPGAGAGSASMLSGMRAAAAPLPSSSSASTGPSAPLATPFSSSSSSSSSSQEPLPQQLRRRIEALFAPIGAPRPRPGQPSRQQLDHTTGLSTEFILSQFRDVADHLAPLFKQVLRGLCELRDKRWYLKKT